ncbi:MAG: pilus assembly protein N-terminal domain-containing protein [Candidatus Zixiibacteriota bacterium]
MENGAKIGIGGFLVLAILLFAFGPFISSSQADNQLLRVMKGKSIVLPYPEKVQTVSLANEDIADVVTVTPTELVVIGKEVGITTLIVWGESQTHTAYDVKVERDVSGQQVVLEVQVAEVNTSAISEYGLDFLMVDRDPSHIKKGDKILGTYGGQVTSPDPDSRDLFAQDGIAGVIKWLGDKREFSTIIKALQQKGDLRLLANPKLLCLSGEEASFLVGGEIPVAVAQTVSAGVPAITVQWKEYGVKLDFVPTIVDTNLVNLKISPEVSSLDWANAIAFGGYTIPAMRTRKADATVELNSEQSVVLGGLLSTEEIKTIKRVPILGHIPIINFFFSRKETNKSETELLIIVSPRIITSVAEETIPLLPGTEPDTLEEVVPEAEEEG